MTRPIEDWADLKFVPGAYLAHIVPWGNTVPLCGAHEDLPSSEWRGTGSMEEQERAANLPLCVSCRVDRSDIVDWAQLMGAPSDQGDPVNTCTKGRAS